MEWSAEQRFLLLNEKDKRELTTFLFELLYARMCIFSYRYISDRTVAEDIVQETFLKFWRSDDPFPSLAAAKGFLYKVVRNDCLNYIKHQVVRDNYLTRQKKVQEESTPDFVESMISAEVAGELVHAINRLPEECRKIFRLSYFDEMSNVEIAKALELSVQTVKNQKSRGYKLLREMLRKNIRALLFFL